MPSQPDDPQRHGLRTDGEETQTTMHPVLQVQGASGECEGSGHFMGAEDLRLQSARRPITDRAYPDTARHTG
jgi:hypothetical protein